MRSFGTRMRAAAAAILSAALILSGAMLAAPAAYADEGAPAEVTQTTETPVAVETSPVETPAPEAPPAESSVPEAPPAESSVPDAPAAEAPAPEAPVAETPAEAESPDAPAEDDLGAQQKSTPQKSARSGITTLGLDAGPQISLSKSSGLDPAGETITVTGSGYNPNQAIYVFLCGDIELPANLWNHALGCQAGAKVVYPPGSVDGQGNPRANLFAADGSFSVTFDVKQLNDGATSVFTAANHTGMADRSQDAKATLTFASLVHTPQVKVEGVSATGADLKVDVKVTDMPGEIYAALIERGTEGNLSQDGGYAAFAYLPTLVNGAGTFSLVASKQKLTQGKQYEVIIWKQHSEITPETVYARADIVITSAQWDKLFSVTSVPVKPETPATPIAQTPGTQTRSAGSLVWGISTGFIDYATGNIAKGSVATQGVGGGRGGYIFPQANGGAWNDSSQTGVIAYSGVVTFTGHGGLMYETFANPVIKVSSATSGTISSSGRTFSLALGSGSKIVNPDGSITWQNVPVNGAIAGGGNGGGGAFAVDPVTFTVGAVSSVSFGSTTVLSAAAQTREPAAAPPATEGVSILTPVDELVPGGEIEISAAGFESNERNILVVLYSDPIVLDRQAGANGDGVVRWIGTLPDDIEPGEHTITMQGSISVGQVITVLSPGEAKSAQVEKSARAAASAAADAELREVAAGPSGGDGSTAWVVWAGAIALLIVAGGMTALVVAQRRRNSTE